MLYPVSIRNASVVLIVTICIAFPCASQDTPVTKKTPATSTTVQPIRPTQTPGRTLQPQTKQTPATQDAPAIKKDSATVTPMQPTGPTHMAPKTSLLPAGQAIVTGHTIVTAKTCKSNNECPTQECWDGFCCDKHCMGKCVSCGMPGHEGTCTPVPDGQDPRRACTIVLGGHPACNTACYSGQCMWPDVGKPCEICAVCNGTGRCTMTPADDDRCGVIPCKSQNTPCRTYDDIRTSRCEAFGLCKTANVVNCVQFTDHYSWLDESGVRRQCATGKIMNCYKDGIHFVWQDGSVIRYCNTGNVCKTCKPEEP